MSFSLKNLEGEVVVKRTAIVAGITAVLHVVVALHWLTIVQSTDAIKAVTSALDFLGMAAGATFVRAGVSPANQVIAPREVAEQLPAVEATLGRIVSDVEAVAPASVRSALTGAATAVAPVVEAVESVVGTPKHSADPYAGT